MGFAPMKNPFIITIAALIGLSISANAVIVMTEDFESPDATSGSPALQQFPTSTASIWVSNQSFNGFRKYVVDENFTFIVSYYHYCRKKIKKRKFNIG